MPATAIDFSYEKDIAPYASRFFGEVSANPNLSSAARTRLQGGILDGAAALQDREFKVREELDQQRSRRLAYETGVTALEEARARRSRAEQAQAQLGGVHALASDILASRDAPEVKRQKLAEARFQNAPALALNPDADQIFTMADQSIPETGKPLISNAERYSAALKGIPQGVIEEAMRTGNLDLIAIAAAEVENEQDAQKEALRLKHAKGAEADRLRNDLVTTPLKFQKSEDPTVESAWLEPESTQKATAIATAFGTPEEQKRFAALKSADSDHARADLIEKIQLREQLRVLQGGKPPADAAARARALIGGR